MTLRPFRLPAHALTFLLLVANLACQSPDKAKKAGKPPSQPSAAPVKGPTAAAAPAAAGSADKPSAKEMRELLAKPIPQSEVDPIVNARGLPAYAGPTGTVRGVVRVVGDPAIEHADVLKKIAPDCGEAKITYAKTPREGAGRTVADVLVAVTGYAGYVPQKEPARLVRGFGCAWETRTIAMTFGQTLRIAAGDARPYVPDLMGQPMPAQLFAMPGAEPVTLPPRKPGRYRLVDSMRLYSVADVFVVAYPTFAVTGVDGKFEISGVPVGKAKLSALLPATMAVSARDIEITAERPVELELTLTFDAKAYEALKVELK